VIVSALLVVCLVGLLFGSAHWPAVVFMAALLLFSPLAFVVLLMVVGGAALFFILFR